ncbi:MAG: hypothetical protein AAF249_15675 [Pseudomonadota bacterium]
MSYQRKFWLFAALAIGSSLVAGVVIGTTIPASGAVANPALVLPFLFMVVGVVMFLSWQWWRVTDDVQKQGQLNSWWWGGNLGAVLFLVTIVVMTGRHSEMSLGAFYLFLAEFAGMLVVYLIWKWRGRGAAE